MNLIHKGSSVEIKKASLALNNDDLIQSYKLKNFEHTITLSKLLIKENENNLVAYTILGLSLSSIDKKEEAEGVYLEGIKKNPKSSDLYNNLSNLYLEKRQYEDARHFAQKAVLLSANCSSSFFTLGISLNACNEKNEAISAFKKSFKFNNKNSSALLQLGNLYKDKKLFSKALDIYRKYQKIFPNHVEGFYNEGCLHLRNERFQVGWDKYDFGLKNNSRCLVKGYYQEDNELWDGKPFDGTLLIYGEQGIGDQIIFSTIIYDLIKIHKKIILKVAKKLVPFLKYNFKDCIIYPEDEDIPKNSYKKFISIGSLCKYFRKNKSDFKNKVFKKYQVKRKNYNLNKLFLNNNPIIGISWYSKNFKTGINRSLSLNEVRKVIDESGYNFINLQYGNSENQINQIHKISKNRVLTIPNIDLTNDINSISNLIINCDLVITIDNTTAHLSSSLGKDTWILLPYSCDFRWFENTEKSLWYESSQLFRQDKSQNWGLTINQILSNLKLKFN